MGLKDRLFGKKEDANKVAYRDEVKKAVSEGKLTRLLIARGLNLAKFGPGGEETESLDFS